MQARPRTLIVRLRLRLGRGNGGLERQPPRRQTTRVLEFP
jgi:hypothetical protein